jgi:hypothetical protein
MDKLLLKSPKQFSVNFSSDLKALMIEIEDTHW